MTNHVEQIYEERARCAAIEEQRCAERSRRVSYGRVLTFLAGAACLLTPVLTTRVPIAWSAGTGAALLVAFFVLVFYHARVDATQRRHGALRAINELSLAKVRRAWGTLSGGSSAAPAGHPYAEDLDLFGHGSLFALLWSGGSEMGRARLADYLLHSAPPDDVIARQQAIEELAPQLDLRQDVLAAARSGSLESHDVERFLAWAEGRPWLSSHRLAVLAIRLLTASIAVLIVLQATGLVADAWWIAPVIVAFLVSNLWAAKLAHVFDQAFSHHAVFRNYATLFRLMTRAECRSPLLEQLRAALVVDRISAHEQMARFDRLMQLAGLRHSALLHLPVQVLTLWDFHVLVAVERWQQHAGAAARRWFEGLATFEAIGTLASLRHDNPSWIFPTIDTGCDAFVATSLGHPLLPDSSRVTNDVAVGPPGTFLLVTGSNMSGKSTLLRAVGVNAVLAQAGAPVCAATLRMPPVRLYTSMRVQDSLEHGVSFFMAAVQRLKQVVEAVEPSPNEPAWLLMYLLDEVLQGTNTAERQVAVRSVLRHLLDERAIGAVTTHDLTLAAAADLSDAAQAVHFTEHLDASGPRTSMTFDYKLRPGIATSRNALKLMQMVGLSVPDQVE